MRSLPPITVSAPDRDRLYALLDNQQGESEVVDLLYDELDRADVVPPDALPPNVATLNSRVRFRNETSGKEHEVVLVMPREVEQGPDRTSVLVPAGAALLGLKAGDSIDWPHKGKTLRLHLIDVVRN